MRKLRLILNVKINWPWRNFARPVRAHLLRIVLARLSNCHDYLQHLSGDSIQRKLFERQRFGLANRYGTPTSPLTAQLHSMPAVLSQAYVLVTRTFYISFVKSTFSIKGDPLSLN